MAPSKPPAKASNKAGGNKPKASGPHKSSLSSKVKKPSGKPSGPKPKAVEQKTKSTGHGPQRKKKRVYTEKELGIPKLNSIVPAGIEKPHGTKKGKNFVDDKESMMTIMAMVQAEKEGNIESKMMRARQMEELRQARKAEQEAREHSKKKKLEDRKDDIRNRKKTNKRDSTASEPAVETESASKPKKKRVSFG